MSVPFSNTHLRVPRGFGALLEGLAREVLRDQPEDIPRFAARYFETILKQREESGVDPAEWAARMEDRFYNNHAFKAAGASQEKEPEATPSKEELSESLTEDESIHSADVSDLSTTQPNVSKETDSAENTEEEQHEIAEKHIISTEKELSEEESVNIVPAEDTQPDGLSGPEEEEAPATTFDEVVSCKERDSSSFLDQDTLESKLEPPDILSFRETSNVCAQELGRAEDEVGVKNASAVVDKETGDLEVDEKAKVEVPVEVFPFLGLADVQVCATELEDTGKTMEENTTGNTTHLVEEESSKSKPERTVEQSLSVSEPPEGNQEEAEDLAEITKEEGGDTRDFSGGIHESLAHIEGVLDDNTKAKEESLVEISFEDIPKAPQTKEDGEKQPREEYSVQVLDTTLSEIQQEDECKVSTVESDQNISGAQGHGESEMVGIEKEVSSEREELGSQNEAPGEMEGEKWNTNDTDLNKSDDDVKEDEGDNNILSLQLNPEADEENLEDEIDLESEDNEQRSEGEFHQNEDFEKDVETSNDPEVKEDETVIFREDEEGTKTEGSSNVVVKTDERGVENLSLQVTQSNMSAATGQAESETLETSMQLPHEESALVESQSQDMSAEKEVTLKEETTHTEELVEDLKMDSCLPEKNDARFEEEDVSPGKSVERLADDHQGEERPPGSEKDTTEPEGSNKEECSRPQEEEDIMDIPLDDPEANRAAAKIQAGFRGHMTRKKMKPEDKTEREEVSSTGDVLNGSQGDTETGGSGAVERDDTSVPEQ